MIDKLDRLHRRRRLDRGRRFLGSLGFEGLQRLRLERDLALHLGLLTGQRLDLGQGIQGRQGLLRLLVGLVRAGQDHLVGLGRLDLGLRSDGILGPLGRRHLADDIVQGAGQAFHRQLGVVFGGGLRLRLDGIRRLGDGRSQAPGRLRLVEIDDLALLRDHLGEIEDVLLGLGLRLAARKSRENLARRFFGRRLLGSRRRGVAVAFTFALFTVGDDPSDGGEYLLH